jgi:hypothetical protein
MLARGRRTEGEWSIKEFVLVVIFCCVLFNVDRLGDWQSVRLVVSVTQN